MADGGIRTKHLRADIEPEDGTRIYVSRRWPRGVKTGSRFSEWMKELAPSIGLLDAVLHEGLAWGRFEELYREELAGEGAQARIAELVERVSGGETITLLCDHPKALPDDECHRFVVAERIEAGLD